MFTLASRKKRKGRKIIIKCEYNAFDMLKKIACLNNSRPNKILSTTDGYKIMLWNDFHWSEKNRKTLLIINLLNVLDAVHEANERERGFRYSFVKLGNTIQSSECRYNDTDLGLSLHEDNGEISTVVRGVI